MSNEPSARQRQWLAAWQSAGKALSKQKVLELSKLSDEEALAMTDSLLSLADSSYHAPWRETWSGLVDMQRALWKADDEQNSPAG